MKINTVEIIVTPLTKDYQAGELIRFGRKICRLTESAIAGSVVIRVESVSDWRDRAFRLSAWVKGEILKARLKIEIWLGVI